MLEKIRKFSSSIYAKILLGIVIIPFVFWGMGSSFKGGSKNVVVIIEKEKHSVQSFIDFIRKFSPPDKKIGDVIKVNNLDQMLWPEHCVQESRGSDFPMTLNFKAINKIIYKGTNSQIDSYSGFYDNGKIHSTGLSNYLKENKITSVDYVGLVTEYCVKFTVFDSIEEGFKTRVILNGIKGINLEESNKVLKEMKSKGIDLL